MLNDSQELRLFSGEDEGNDDDEKQLDVASQFGCAALSGIEHAAEVAISHGLLLIRRACRGPYREAGIASAPNRSFAVCFTATKDE